MLDEIQLTTLQIIALTFIFSFWSNRKFLIEFWIHPFFEVLIFFRKIDRKVSLEAIVYRTLSNITLVAFILNVPFRIISMEELALITYCVFILFFIAAVIEMILHFLKWIFNR